MPITYAQLLKGLQGLNPEQLQQDATIFCHIADEALPVQLVEVVDGAHSLDGVLDKGHVVLTIDF